MDINYFKQLLTKFTIKQSLIQTAYRGGQQDTAAVAEQGLARTIDLALLSQGKMFAGNEFG